jgi:Tol biopolymer transport system component
LFEDAVPANETTPNGKRLESWKEIAAYLNREVRTAIRWEKERGLPVHRIPGKRSGVYALASEVDAWLRTEAVGLSNGGAPEVRPLAPQAGARKRGPWTAASVATVVFGVAALLLSVSAIRPATPHLINPVLVTNDGLVKGGLMFGGRSRYFITRNGERWTFMRAPAGGTPSSLFSYVLGSLWPLDIASDESELLISRADPSTAPGRPLWIIPTSGGSGRKVTEFMVNDAAWSPDGKMLAYASGNDLYLANRDGTAPHRLTTLPGTVDALCWSPDCKRLRLAIEERKTTESIRLWEVQLDRPIARRVLPGWSRPPRDYERPGRWTPNGEFFVFAAVHEGTPGLFAIRERRTLFDMGIPAPIRLITSPEGVSSPTPSPDGKKIYAVVQSSLRGELTRLEPKSGQPIVWPGMPGLSAGQVAFSPDGHEAAYITYPEFNLWKMKADGTERRQLTFGASKAAMPQWSPDGRRIAFMGWDGDENRPTKIRIIPADGGPPEQPVPWPGWQGIPNWTPDGTSLIFGENGLLNPIPASCSLHRFDFQTGKTSDLPGTTGLWTPRASPAGRYLAATTPRNSKLVLYDMQTAHVTDLVTFPDSRIGDNPTWSKDGRFIYIDAPLAPDPAVYRLRIADKHRERVASLKGIQRANMDYWVGLTPDGSPLVTRRVQGSEIYSWDWVAR